MRLSIIVPVYNEHSTIEEVVHQVLNVEVSLDKELIVVDDHSTDGTRELLEKLEREDQIQAGEAKIKIIRHERNRGKGAAIRTGLHHVTGDIVLIQDADLELDPRDYQKLLDPILTGQADVVFGNRFHCAAHQVLNFWHYLGNRFLTTLSNMLTDLNLSDMEVGYKVFRRDVLKRVTLRSDRFGFEPEFTIKVAKGGWRIYEVPITYHGRTYAEGKKISWKDGAAAIYYLVRYRIFE